MKATAITLVLALGAMAAVGFTRDRVAAPELGQLVPDSVAANLRGGDCPTCSLNFCNGARCPLDCFDDPDPSGSYTSDLLDPIKCGGTSTQCSTWWQGQQCNSSSSGGGR